MSAESMLPIYSADKNQDEKFHLTITTENLDTV